MQRQEGILQVRHPEAAAECGGAMHWPRLRRDSEEDSEGHRLPTHHARGDAPALLCPRLICRHSVDTGGSY
jgi:hypothetical protein